MENEQRSILLVDDHPLFRHGLSALVATCADLHVIAEATSGQEAIERAEELQPDIILMDIHMPDINGIEATRRILHTSPHIRILIITMFEDDSSVFAAMRAGARGYILKDTQKDAMLHAIRAIGRGEAIFGPAIATRLMNFFTTAQPATPGHKELFPDLTQREREILELIAQGKNNQEIANQLILGHNTVRNYVSNIFSKLQVVDRAQAIIRAREGGLGLN
ncbi:DNA-binding response regulator [Dictyobacter alpinus]|uniref:DNA-binding response regulator n=1 Tax=Dictyobacter alpinus TaxID=2014873 RepID=A0A402BHZ9_9CHLR|nr:response regulator transcription factor [Dictyobacter alpinus]GCE31034.1 DNA-binding response regulator [Dictyobacter alpinus]